MTSEKELCHQCEPITRPMSLEGMEAVELYVAQMEENLDELTEQTALLNKAIAERAELVLQIAACLAEQDQLLREIEFSRMIARRIV